MARLRSFTLDGEAIRVCASLNNAGKPVYRVSLADGYDNRPISSEDLLYFAQMLQHDVSDWYGILNRYPEDTFTYGTLADFEKTWGGNLDGIPLHPAPEE